MYKWGLILMWVMSGALKTAEMRVRVLIRKLTDASVSPLGVIGRWDEYIFVVYVLWEILMVKECDILVEGVK